MDRGELGRWGESKAAAHLEAAGYVILERNFRCRSGEINIIAQRNGLLCFVEVKARTSIAFGLPCQAVGPGKQNRIRRAALAYLRRNPGYADWDLRMDVIELLKLPQGAYIRHITAAF